MLAGKCNEPAERRYYDEVIRPMLGPDVTVVLDADRKAVLRLLVEARCLVMPIQWEEPFGIVMLEAMATGTPVVALNRGAVPELVRPGVSGLICQRSDELPAACGGLWSSTRRTAWRTWPGPSPPSGWPPATRRCTAASSRRDPPGRGSRAGPVTPA